MLIRSAPPARRLARVAGSLVLASTILMAACSTTGRVALISDGDLEQKQLSAMRSDGPILEGSSCGASHSLAAAFRDALKTTAYDTLVDVDVETTTGLIVFANCINVRGRAIDSRALPNKQERAS